MMMFENVSLFFLSGLRNLQFKFIQQFKQKNENENKMKSKENNTHKK